MKKIGAFLSGLPFWFGYIPAYCAGLIVRGTKTGYKLGSNIGKNETDK